MEYFQARQQLYKLILRVFRTKDLTRSRIVYNTTLWLWVEFGVEVRLISHRVPLITQYLSEGNQW